VGFFGCSMLIRADIDVTMVHRPRRRRHARRRIHRQLRVALRPVAAKPATDDDVRAVAERVGAPFLPVFVIDSDFAEVLCAAPGQATFDLVLPPGSPPATTTRATLRRRKPQCPNLLRWAG
jgi:hypothetical protein